MGRKRFNFDYTLCVGCEGCVVACKQQNRAEKGQGLRRVLVVNSGRDYKMPSYPLSFACNHCQAPKCLQACLKKAIIKRDDGVVALNQKLCNQCRDCIGACPYQAIKYNDDKNKIIKCNMCVDNIPEGETPMCVENCPTGALTLVEDEGKNVSEYILDEIYKDLNKRIKEIR